MTSNVKMILDEVNARIKLAEAKTAEDPSNFDSFPGAENDKAVPAETKKPDPEVKDEGPASRTEVTGAEPGSDAPVQQDHLYEADEPVLTPDKKPEDTADANAKEASAKDVNPDIQKVASDILSIIKDSMNKQAECGKKDVEKKMEKKEECKSGTCGTCSGSSCGKTLVKKEECKCKKASDMISLGDKILSKIASIREERMAKEAGAADAMELLKAAAEYNRGANDAKALIQKIAQALEDSANSADATEEGTGTTDTPEAAGAADAEAAIADAAAATASGEETAAPAEDENPVTPEEVAQAVSELVDEGQISSEEAATLVSELGADTAATAEGNSEGVTEDQIVEGIVQAIDNGDITEDEAQQLVQELVDAGADASVAEEVADNASAAADASVAPEEPSSAPVAASEDAAAAEEAAGAADAEAAIADASKQASVQNIRTKIASALQKKASEKQAADEQIKRYQKGFIQKCAEYGADPQRVAQYIQARMSGKL